jgi:hypothetical protein
MSVLFEVGRSTMSSTRILRTGVAVGFCLGLVWAASPPAAHAAWVNTGATAFQVGGQLQTITLTANTTVDGTSVDPTCSSMQGGTSMAIVQGSKLANVDSVLYPVLLVVSCLAGDSATAARLNFINPANGKVIKAISTTPTPTGGWAHLVNRPDKGDLLGCGGDGTLYSIDFSQFTSTIDGTATSVPRPSGLPTNCVALGWDPEEDMIYQGFSGPLSGIEIRRFKDATGTVPPDYNTPCTASGVAITGGVLVVLCNDHVTVLRLDKTSGTILTVNGTLSVLGLPVGDLACDPVSFAGQFSDALWSRQGSKGNGAVALEFPAFTCGLPSNATILAAGLSAPAGGVAGASPRTACFADDGSGKWKVVDADGDGIPDCWEDQTLWLADADGKQRPGIDFDGNGTRDLALCVMVDTNGDGVADTEECADKYHKDLFVEIDYMKDHKPDPLALSQPASTTSVQSVRAAFAAAPVNNPLGGTGIRIHLQVKDETAPGSGTSVTFNTLAGTPPSTPGHVSQLVFTPCTGPASFAISASDAADFDAIKKANFGAVAGVLPGVNTINAKRLAFRYVLFAHNQVSATSPGGGSTGSGCSEIGGDDAALTLGSFTSTIVGGVSHNRGTTDQQAGTFMHEFGHTLGLRHGGGDNDNCKPNYLSVMSYSRQFAGSPIANRRLDYSRAVLPDLDEVFDSSNPLLHPGLNELLGLGADGSLGSFTFGGFSFAADQTAYGPGTFSVAPALGVSCSGGTHCINWNKNKQGTGPKYDTTPVSADINQGPGCDGSGTFHEGHDDWGNLLYRASAALDFAGGARSTNAAEHKSITSPQEAELFLAGDLDANGIPDAEDCNFKAFSATTLPVAPNATTVPIGTNPTFAGFAPSGTAFLGPDRDRHL